MPFREKLIIIIKLKLEDLRKTVLISIAIFYFDNDGNINYVQFWLSWFIFSNDNVRKDSWQAINFLFKACY